MSNLSSPISFRHGPAVGNRFYLAPLTNQQSHSDGTLSDDEFHWLTMRAQGGHGIVMTCASHVSVNGQGFPGQLGCFSDEQLPGLKRLAEGIKKSGSLALVQLHHAGRRSPANLIGGQPVSSADDGDTSARALTTDEVQAVIEDFVVAAVRCDKAGFDGVELHGAHDYLLCQFLNAELNQRNDQYGGSQENRERIFMEIISGIRKRCRPDFNLSVRLSPERFGMVTADVRHAFENFAGTGLIDWIDMSLWDITRPAHDESLKGQRLVDVVCSWDRSAALLGVAGKIYDAQTAQGALDAGADLVGLGRASITNHDFPHHAITDPSFSMRALPVSAEVLRAEGLGESFVAYMKGWQGFVED
jgi:2,4-dienoyl-CoA reductase-like NADH-dependent reductase (Old Yellow Enzyme family)